MLTGILGRGHVFLLIGLQDLLEPVALLGQEGNLALQSSLLGSRGSSGRGGGLGCGHSLLLLLLQQADLACKPAAEVSGSRLRAAQALLETVWTIRCSLACQKEWERSWIRQLHCCRLCMMVMQLHFVHASRHMQMVHAHPAAP